MNITIRNIPDDVINKIRNISQIEKRSLNNEILILLEQGVQKETHQHFSTNKNINKTAQINIWKGLAGKWQDERSTDEIINDIYQNRTLGRDFQIWYF